MNQNVLLVIPCFFESGRVAGFLEELGRAMEATGGVSILIVDDGSDADEKKRMDALVEERRRRFPFIQPIHHLMKNEGKGGAVYAGWSAPTEARWLAFSDADGSCTAAEVARLIAMARMEDAPQRAYFASRVKLLGRKVTRVWYRYLMGHVYAMLVDWLLQISAHDTQCGLKLVPREGFERVRGQLTIHRYAFDAELLVALLDSGTDVVELPIDWHEEMGGKVSLFRDPWRMLGDVLRVRKRRAAGHYGSGARGIGMGT